MKYISEYRNIGIWEYMNMEIWRYKDGRMKGNISRTLLFSYTFNR